ncbi:MAG: endonuclease/exonuclease/phosphatase family protein [Cystobacter sp.]
MSPSQPNGEPVPGPFAYTLRIASLNIWNPGPDKVRRNQELAARLRERNLDVVLLQEMEGSPEQLELFKRGSGLSYGLQAKTLAILSRHALEDADAPFLQRKPSLLPIRQLFTFREVYFCCASFQHNGRRHHVSSHHWDNRKAVNRTMASAAISARVSRLPTSTVALCGGDFNATRKSDEVSRVLEAGLRDSGPADDDECIDFVFYGGADVQVVRHTRETFPDLTDHPLLLHEFNIRDPRLPVA